MHLCVHVCTCIRALVYTRIHMCGDQFQIYSLGAVYFVFFALILKSHLFIICVCLFCACVYHVLYVQELRTTCGSWYSLFYHVCSRNKTQVVGLGGQCLYLLGYLTDIFVLLCEQGSVTAA